MPEPTQEELEESIQALRTYRDRLKNEVTSISQKLRIPEKQVKSSLKDHAELKQIENILDRLISQKSNEIKHNK